MLNGLSIAARVWCPKPGRYASPAPSSIHPCERTLSTSILLPSSTGNSVGPFILVAPHSRFESPGVSSTSVKVVLADSGTDFSV